MSGSHALWYASRGTGLAAFVALTLALGLGQLLASGFRTRVWPRVASNEAHRLLSLTATGLIVLHVLTILGDSYLPFRPLDAVVPFAAPYRSLSVGLGTLAFDATLVTLVFVALRRRIGYTRWKRIHYLAYAVWGLAVAHGLGAGTDTNTTWMRVTAALCLAFVAWGVARRLGAERQLALPLAGAAAAAALVLAVVLGHPASTARAASQGLHTPIAITWNADVGQHLEAVTMLGAGPAGKDVHFRLDLVLGSRTSRQGGLQHGLVQLAYPPGRRCQGQVRFLSPQRLLARCGRRPLRIDFSEFTDGSAAGVLRLGDVS